MTSLFLRTCSDSAVSQTPCLGGKLFNPQKQRKQLVSDGGQEVTEEPCAGGQPGSSSRGKTMTRLPPHSHTSKHQAEHREGAASPKFSQPLFGGGLGQASAAPERAHRQP